MLAMSVHFDITVTEHLLICIFERIWVHLLTENTGRSSYLYFPCTRMESPCTRMEAPSWRRPGAYAFRRAQHCVLRGANPCDERARGNALHAAHMLWV